MKRNPARVKGGKAAAKPREERHKLLDKLRKGIAEEEASLRSLEEEIKADKAKERKAYWKDHGLTMPKIILEEWKMIQKRDKLSRPGLTDGLVRPLREKYLKNGKLDAQRVRDDMKDIESAIPGLEKEIARLETKAKNKEYRDNKEAWRAKFDVQDMRYLRMYAMAARRGLQGILNREKGLKLIPEKSSFNSRNYKIVNPERVRKL